MPPDAPPPPTRAADPAAEDALLRDLAARGGLEFAAYQRDSMVRRVRHRMALAGAADVAEYRSLLAADPGEHRRLCDAVPVHRTEFFRDPAAWEYVSDRVVPGLLAGKPAGAPLRAWSAGCATGEEAYTLAMVLAGAAGPDALAAGRVTVFATDVSGRAVAAARAGRYRDEALDAVPQPLREKYFAPCEGGRAVVPALRRAVVFAAHDLLRDPPMHRVDLIACRNTLMYFTPPAQAAALARLYLGLAGGGALFVGPAESPVTWSELFWAECRHHRVYRPAADRTEDAVMFLARRRPPGRPV